MATLEELKARLTAAIEENKVQNKRFEPIKNLEAAAKKFKTAEGQDKAAAKKELEAAFIAVKKAGFTLPAPLQIIFDQCSKAFGTAEAKAETEPQLQIQNPVGENGTNTLTDVLIVQSLLNNQGANLKITGACNEDTIAAIKNFQKKIGLKKRDGLISPDGKTWKKLYEARNNDRLQMPSKKTYNYKNFVLQLFVKGKGDTNDIDPNDVKQGKLSNCYFIASLYAIAKTDPEAIRNLIKDNGDGSYDVTLYAKGDKVALIPQVITVKPQFPAIGKDPAYAGKGDNEMWVMIVEKAFAKMMGSYENIEYNTPEFAMEAITGKDATAWPVKSPSHMLFSMITKALDENIPIVAGTYENIKTVIIKSGDKVYGKHVYTIVAFDGAIIELRNPWAEQDVRITTEEFKQLYETVTFQTTDIRFNAQQKE